MNLSRCFENQALNERGERLMNLENKFTNLNQGAEDFLKTIREYNEKQANKPWWKI